MEEYRIRKLRAFFDEDIKKLSEIESWKKVTVRGVQISRKTIQRAYKEMKVDNFRGDITDYLCYVCLMEFTRLVGVVYSHKVQFKNASIFLWTYCVCNPEIINLICRLNLKDETYLTEALKKNSIEEKSKLFIEAKKIVASFIYMFFSREPKDIKKLNKLLNS